MNERVQREHRERSRSDHNDEFLRRLFARRPKARARFQERLAEAEAAPVPEGTLESRLGAAALPALSSRELVAETIVSEERPVLFLRDDWIDRENVTAIGEEAEELIQDLDAEKQRLKPLMPLVGRIDVTDFPNIDFVGTGWLVDTDIVVTNRHVASLIARWDGRRFAFSRGVGGRTISASVNTLHEFDDLAVDQARAFAVKEVLYIEPESGPDIAFLRVVRQTDGARQDRIVVAATDIGEDKRVVVVGYPARAPKRVIPDQDLMKRLYRDRYDVKRAAPGLTMGPEGRSARHDCTTLGGNSGSCVLDMKTGEAVGLHFAGLYQEANFAVPASLLNDYIKRKRWNQPHVLETFPPRIVAPTAPSPRPRPQAVPPVAPPAPPAAAGPSAAGSVTITIPLSITVTLGQPLGAGALVHGKAADPDSTGAMTGGGALLSDPAAAEAAAVAFWDEKPDGVVAVRVGFAEEGDAIGDEPFIAASVPPGDLASVTARGPATYRGFAVRYQPADVAEQIDSEALVEAPDRVSYDDDARRGAGFSFRPVEEAMVVRAHVGPEYSWDELKRFLDESEGHLVSAMYEFHGAHIKNAIEARLSAGASLTLVLDNATFSGVRDEDEEFDRIPVFKRWQSRFAERFERVVAPEGVSGLISNSYHIKVTVRDDDTFWLSSGNWKRGSSQPIITQQQRDNATEEDLPGNREWHVVIRSRTLAARFRNHIRQDFKRSRDLGGGNVPPSKEATDRWVDVAIEAAAFVEERKPPRAVLEPRIIDRKVRVTPLLTPDREGEIYSEAVLELIRSARTSLLFQIPYIGMPSNPRTDRGYIDELIKALTQKLKTLPDARVLLRVGGSRFSAPTHAAWFFKSKGVDVDARVHQIENHHTKGMIVDGKRVLIGSHNWSQPGVTLNRDASLVFDDEEIASYYAEAFEIDWQRSTPVRPRRFVKSEAAIVEAVGDQPPPGFRRVRLSELLKDDD